MQSVPAAEIYSKSIIPNGRVLRVDAPSRQPRTGAGDRESRTPPNRRAIGLW